LGKAVTYKEVVDTLRKHDSFWMALAIFIPMKVTGLHDEETLAVGGDGVRGSRSTFI